jgi:Uma2 family endonuclease
MQQARPEHLAEFDIVWPPTEDDLPYDDGEPMETERHVMQMFLLIEPLREFWADRPDVYIGGNMFLYFSLEQVRNRDFRGPDFFAVLGVPRRERKSWVVWQEGKAPDVIVELLSESTAAVDRGEKKQVYQDELRVPEYFWYDPFSAELAGFSLRDGAYEPIAPDAAGRLPSHRLGLSLVRWPGQYSNIDATWLRWATPDGMLLPTSAERATQAERRLAEVEARLARLEARFGSLSEDQS